VAEARPTPGKWHIDTLDARGGLAFASWRSADLADEANLPDRPVFHFSPPAFTPTPVASAATALAAERYGFQLGLYDAEGEVPFDSLAEVAEFVRRIYVGSGRSDGTDGDGDTPPVPPPEPESPSPTEGLPLVPTEGGWLRRSTSTFRSLVGLAHRGSSRPMTWSVSEPSSYDLKKASADASLVLLGAELTLFELLRRFPADQQKLETWRQAAARLASTLLRTGAAQVLLDNETRPIHKTCFAFLSNLQSRAPHGKDTYKFDFEHFAFYWTIKFMIAPNELNSLRFPYEFALPLPGFALAEPLDDLAHFPVSVRDAAAAGAPDFSTASVADVLSSVLASPTRIEKFSTLDAIVAFAAARIVAFDGARWTSAQLRFNDGLSQSRDLDRTRFERLTLEAFKWLARELPARAFSTSVEALIEEGLADPLEGTARASSGSGKASASAV
jgi:hypothetical protein